MVPLSRSAVLFDPHPLWLEAVEALLARMDVTVAEKAADVQQALEAVKRHLPDLLITEMTDAAGEDVGDAIRAARAANPELRVIVVSAQSEPRYVDAALAAGAVAYVIKTARREDLMTTVRQAFEHSVFFAANAAHRLPPTPTAETVDAAAAQLTKRELEILRLVADGRSNAQVARALWVTEQTVKFHLSNVYRKLDVANRTEASRWAQTNGLLAAPRGSASEPSS